MTSAPATKSFYTKGASRSERDSFQQSFTLVFRTIILLERHYGGVKN